MKEEKETEYLATGHMLDLKAQQTDWGQCGFCAEQKNANNWDRTGLLSRR